MWIGLVRTLCRENIESVLEFILCVIDVELGIFWTFARFRQ